MYKIIGADGKEYGPVSAEQLRQWVAEGRANAASQVRAEGGTEWQPLSSFPELAVAPAAPPSAGPPGEPALAGVGRTVDIGRCISRGWQLVTKNIALLLSATLVIGLILVVVGGALRWGINVSRGVTLHDVFHARGLRMLRLQWPGMLVSSLWFMLATGPLVGGLCQLYLKLIRQQPASFGDAFAGFGVSLGQLTLASLVRALLTYVGFCCCILPAIYLTVAWKFTLPLVIDKQLGFWEAMELSRKVVTHQWWVVFALVLLTGLIAAAGLLVCCVGFLVTVPVAMASLLYAYEDLFGTTPPPV